MIKPVRGMNDIFSEQIPYWHALEEHIRNLMHTHCYNEIRFPIVERTALFKRSVGEATDIVEKEMYTFADRNDEDLTLRPEGTAGCVRAGITNGLLYNQTQRLWYQGPMFRYERPQKGRYRQFHQFGVETFGFPGPDMDVEVILLSARLWRSLGLNHHVHLELNSLGTLECRKAYREKLVAYFTEHQEQLDEDSQRRLTTNPLRILDSKNPKMAELISKAPKLIDSLSDDSKKHFFELCRLLDATGIGYKINPYLVRGLDYYTHTVFEWVTSELGAQGTVCAGGRYDGLVEQLDGKPTPGFGFAIGMERIVELIMEKNPGLAKERVPTAYIAYQGDLGHEHALLLTERMYDELPEVDFILHSGSASFKNQLKKADKSGAKLCLIIGEDEAASGSVTVKHLREDAPQDTILLSDIIDYLRG